MAQGASLIYWSALQWTRQLVSKGNKVIGSCRNPAEAAELKKVGVAHVAKLDVTDPNSIEVVAADSVICSKLIDLRKSSMSNPILTPIPTPISRPNLDSCSFLGPHKHPHESQVQHSAICRFHPRAVGSGCKSPVNQLILLCTCPAKNKHTVAVYNNTCRIQGSCNHPAEHPAYGRQGLMQIIKQLVFAYGISMTV